VTLAISLLLQFPELLVNVRGLLVASPQAEFPSSLAILLEPSRESIVDVCG